MHVFLTVHRESIGVVTILYVCTGARNEKHVFLNLEQKSEI